MIGALLLLGESTRAMTACRLQCTVDALCCSSLARTGSCGCFIIVPCIAACRHLASIAEPVRAQGSPPGPHLSGCELLTCLLQSDITVFK